MASGVGGGEMAFPLNLTFSLREKEQGVRNPKRSPVRDW